MASEPRVGMKVYKDDAAEADEEEEEARAYLSVNCLFSLATNLPATLKVAPVYL